MQKLKGSGVAIIAAGGWGEFIELNNSSIKVETGSLLGFSSGLELDVYTIINIKTAAFGGEGCFLSTLKGTGVAIVQTLPFDAMCGQIGAQIAPLIETQLFK